MAKAIGTLGTIDTISIGGRVFTDLTTLIRLGGTNGTNANCTFRAPNTSAGYQVTSGKTFTIRAVRASTRTYGATSALSFYLVYADNDVGNDSASAYTNPVYEFGLQVAHYIVQSQVVPYWESVTSFAVAAQKYPAFTQTATGSQVSCEIFGYET